MSEFVIESITELFHLVKSLIPDGQSPVCVTPTTTVSGAVQLMRDHHFSQLPVIEGNAVLGVFSYRSFAARLLRMGRMKEFVGDLPVDEFVEQFTFVQHSDNWENILDYLDKDDVVLVGGHKQLTGIVTTMDVLNYLRKVASPFVLMAEIEMSLRRVIRACVSEEELRICALNGLASKYPTQEDVPTDLTQMEFNDYAQIIGNRENWPSFATVFGESDWSRTSTTQKLFQIRNLRNDVFHFKRKIEQQDVQHLTEFRDWLQLKARAFEARQVSQNSKETESSTKPTEKKKWNETAFFATLSENVGEAEVGTARKILAWAKENMPELWWGEGKIYGSFTPGFTHEGIWHQAIGVWTNGTVELQFYYMRGRPVFNDDEKRLELLERFNQVPGIHLSEEQINLRPSISLTILTNDAILNEFLNILNWFVDQIRYTKTGLADRRVLRYQFWLQLLETAKEKTTIHANISPSRDNWISASSGVRGVAYSYAVRMQDARIELDIDRGNKLENKQIFEALHNKREEIENRFGDRLEWLPMHDKRASKIQYVINSGGLREQHLWPQMQERLIDAMVRFSEAVQPEINLLSV